MKRLFRKGRFRGKNFWKSLMPKKSFKLYLASQSSRRREILEKMGIAFNVVSSRYRERWCRKSFPEDLCIRHALGKVQKAVLPPGARFVLGGDTIVWHEGHGLGKPRTRSEALHMVRRLAGKQHVVYTGLVLHDRKTGHTLQGYAKTDVWIKKLSEVAIQDYVNTIHPYDKAGAYAIQMRPKIVRRIRGSYSNVVGFPKELFQKMLKQILQKTEDHGKKP